jgi:hypothetical protein
LEAGDTVCISWGKRLLNAPGLLFLKSQKLLLQLLADYEHDGPKLLAIVDAIGGIKEVFKRFFQHYDVS